jgi:hypothetical protein
LQNTGIDFCCSSIFKPQQHWQKCLDHFGDLVEYW